MLLRGLGREEVWGPIFTAWRAGENERGRCLRREHGRGDGAMRAASLIVSDSRKCSGEEGTVGETGVGHVRK